MKSGPWRWLKRLPALLAAPRPEPVAQAQRLLALQRNIILPARLVVLGVVFYQRFQSPWLTDVATNYGVLLETIQNVFDGYALLTVAVTVLVYVVRWFPPGTLLWTLFIMGLGDGIFLAGVTVLTGGFGSILYWVYPALIVLNALAIPLATPQIVLNLLLAVFYLAAGLLEAGAPLEFTLPSQEKFKPRSRIHAEDLRDLSSIVVRLKKPQEPWPESFWSVLSESSRTKLSTPLWDQLAEATQAKVSAFLQNGVDEMSAKKKLAEDLNRILFPAPRIIVGGEPPETPADPYVLRVAVLLLLTLCCYGVQVLAAKEQQAEEEQKELIFRTGQLHSAGRLAAEFAHQIKNPLAIINNATYSLQRALKDSRPETAKQVAMIQEEIGRADQIITEIMGYAQLNEGRVEKLDVIEDLDRALQQVFPPGLAPHLQVDRRYEGHFPPLLMQRRHFSQCVANLLQNAREAVGDHGHVGLAAQCESDGSVVITVSDDGPGIPPDKLERVFEAYYSTKARGTGLGLAIVKHNVELYGGSVRVQSELGKGARFTLFLPAKTLTRLDS